MRIIKLFIVILAVSVIAISCKPTKDMSLKEYAAIEEEINLPNPEVDKNRVIEVTKKYGYTYEQFKKMYDSVQSDPKKLEKLGELRLKDQQSKEEK